MRKRRGRSKFHEPTLVPLADMLTNTVGVMVFILIFTVLTAGGVVISKRLPMERPTLAEPFYVVCSENRVMPMNIRPLVEEFVEPLGEPTISTVDAWLEGYNARQVEDNSFTVRGEGQYLWSLMLSMEFKPKAGAGETIEELQKPDSKFRQFLKQHKSDDSFIYLFVQPDSLDAFYAARALATEQMGFKYGWNPLEEHGSIRFSLGGGGRTATYQ